MYVNVRNLFQTKDLIFAWTGRTVRGRYQQSLLGWFWAIIQPAALVVVFSVIFTYFVPIDTGGNVPYPVFSYVAIVPWTFFAFSLTDMSNSLVSNISLVTKIYFPREALPIAAMLARLIDFGIASLILLVLMIMFKVPVNPVALLSLPLILIVQIILILGLGLAASAFNIFFRDIQPLLALGLQILMYASPVIYPATMVPEYLQPYYFLNPMAGIITAYRDILINQSFPGTYMIPSTLISVFIFVFGYWVFKRLEFQFADIV